MKELIEKLMDIELVLSKRLGVFNLFALSEREDIQNKFDLLVSLELNGMTKNELFGLLHLELAKKLTGDQLLMLSRFIYLDPREAFVLNVNSLISVNHGNVEIKDSSINGIQLKHAVVISSSRTIDEPKKAS